MRPSHLLTCDSNNESQGKLNYFSSLHWLPKQIWSLFYDNGQYGGYLENKIK